jgi:hypothetical protein
MIDPEKFNDLPLEEMSLDPKPPSKDDLSWREFWAWMATVPEAFHSHWYHWAALRLKALGRPKWYEGLRGFDKN